MHDTDYRGCKITRHPNGKWSASGDDLLGVGIDFRKTAESERAIHATVDEMYVIAEKKLATLKDLAAKVKEGQTALDGLLVSAKEIGKQAIAKARQIGNYIREARCLVSKGQWMKWLENETGVKYQTARKYMKIAQTPPEHLDWCGSLMDAYYYLGLDKPRRKPSEGKKKGTLSTAPSTPATPNVPDPSDEAESQRRYEELKSILSPTNSTSAGAMPTDTSAETNTAESEDDEESEINPDTARLQEIQDMQASIVEWDAILSAAVETVLGSIEQTNGNAADWLEKVAPIVERYYQVKEDHDAKAEHNELQEAA